MVLAGSVLGVEAACLYDVVVNVYGHDIDLVAVSVYCVRYVGYYHCVVGAPGVGVDVKAGS